MSQSPTKLCKAERTLRCKHALTACELGHYIGCTHDEAASLLRYALCAAGVSRPVGAGVYEWTAPTDPECVIARTERALREAGPLDADGVRARLGPRVRLPLVKFALHWLWEFGRAAAEERAWFVPPSAPRPLESGCEDCTTMRDWVCAALAENGRMTSDELYCTLCGRWPSLRLDYLRRLLVDMMDEGWLVRTRLNAKSRYQWGLAS